MILKKLKNMFKKKEKSAFTETNLHGLNVSVYKPVITQEDYEIEIRLIPDSYITCQRPASNLHFKTEAEIIQEEWDKFLEDGPKDEKK